MYKIIYSTVILKEKESFVAVCKGERVIVECEVLISRFLVWNPESPTDRVVFNNRSEIGGKPEIRDKVEYTLVTNTQIKNRNSTVQYFRSIAQFNAKKSMVMRCSDGLGVNHQMKHLRVVIKSESCHIYF